MWKVAKLKPKDKGREGQGSGEEDVGVPSPDSSFLSQLYPPLSLFRKARLIKLGMEGMTQGAAFNLVGTEWKAQAVEINNNRHLY